MQNQTYYNLTTTLLPDEKLKEIFNRLDSLKPGMIVKVDNAENIPYIKQYIDVYSDVEFNEDFTKLRKIDNFAFE